MSQDRRFEWPQDQLDAMNARLDFEAEADRKWILFTDRVERDIELTFGGTVNGGRTRKAGDRYATVRPRPLIDPPCYPD